MGKQASKRVPLGRAGTGSATVYDSSPTVSLYGQLKQNQQRMEAARAARAAAQAKKNQEDWAKMVEWNPEKGWEPFNAQIRNQANGVREFMMQAQRMGIDPSDPNFRKDLQALKDGVNNQADMTNYYKTQYNTALAQATKNPSTSYMYNIPEVKKAINNVLFEFDEQGNMLPRNLSQMNVTAGLAAVLSNPDLYNEDAIFDKWLDGFEESTENYMRIQRDMYGDQEKVFDQTDTYKGKMAFFKRRDDGTLLMHNNRPIPDYSNPHVLSIAKSDPIVGQLIRRAEAMGEDPAEYLERNLISKVGMDVKKDKKHFRDWDPYAGGGWIKKPDDVTVQNDKTRNVEISNAKMGEQVIGAYTPQEVVFKDANKTMKISGRRFFSISPSRSQDAEGGKLNEKQEVGDVDFNVTRLILLPTNTQTGKPRYEDMKQTESLVRNPHSSKINQLKWYAYGTVTPAGGGGESYAALLPVDDDEGKIKKIYGVDLDQRTLADMHPLEMYQVIRQDNPEATDEWIREQVEYVMSQREQQ